MTAENNFLVMNAAQHCAKAEGCVNDDPRGRRDALQEGWGFRVGTWNVDSLTGRAGELVEVWQIEKWMWHIFKRQDGRVVGAGCFCSGWEVRRKLMV